MAKIKRKRKNTYNKVGNKCEILCTDRIHFSLYGAYFTHTKYTQYLICNLVAYQCAIDAVVVLMCAALLIFHL